MPIYAMFVFKLSSKALQALESFFKKFSWEGAKKIKKIPLFNWDIVCKTKESGGGGLRKMEMQNLAMGEKLIWKMYRSPEKLWCSIMQKKYLDDSNPIRILMANGISDGLGVRKFMNECRHIIMDHLT